VERILIIDDDVQLCAMLAMYLSRHGMKVSVEHHAQGGIQAIRRQDVELIVLDVMLPGLDGFSLLRSLRTWSDVRVLLLTGRGGQDDRITGFESGADDYLAKPFHPPELIARIRAILRRNSTTARTSTGRSEISAGNVVVNVKSRSASIGAEPLELTAAEFDLLAAFLESPGTILTRDWLFQRVFAREFHPEDRSLDMSVSRLRRKMDAVGARQASIITIRSAGYLFSVGT
jgi:two-component system response regulator CpxR